MKPLFCDGDGTWWDTVWQERRLCMVRLCACHDDRPLSEADAECAREKARRILEEEQKK